MSARFGGRGGGGKKGPRQQNGSFRVPGVKLRPAPEKAFLDATDNSKRAQSTGKRLPIADPSIVAPYEAQEQEEERHEFGYRENLQTERRPLEGVLLCVTGATDIKASLLIQAAELGAQTSKVLTVATTHLIANAMGSDKYNVQPIQSFTKYRSLR